MKRKYYILILFAILLAGCTDDVWLDHDDPRVYIPKYGFSINKAWLQESNEYTIEVSVYCSGLRQENQNQEISIDYSVVPELITAYNEDITQQYAGEIIELPSECYSFIDNKIVIPKGKTHGELPIRIDLQKIKALGLGLNEVKYAIPVRLSSTSHYNLQEDVNMLEAIYCITLDEPSFYFWDNRDEDEKILEKKLIYGEENETVEYRITSYGLGITVPEDFTLNFDIDGDAVPRGGELLPSDAYEFPSTVTFAKGSSDTYLPVKLINNNVKFRKEYYLPISISSSSKYAPHITKGTLLLKVTIKNDYEWNYTSRQNIECSGLVSTGENTKTSKSYESDILILDIFGDYYNAADNWSNMYRMAIPYSVGIKIIPTQDKRHYNVELIRTNSSMTGKNWSGYQSPRTLELDPEKDSYYDWDYETFHLNYRYRKYDDPDEDWVYVTEILEAQ